MLGRFKSIFVFVFVLALSLVLAKSALAFETSSVDKENGDLSLSASQTINDNYFAFGNLVTLDGSVSGDLFTAGNQLEINGQFGNNVFAAGNNVLLKGKINRDVFVAAATITIDKDAVIEGDFSAFANTIIINGEVKGTVRSGANSLTVNGNVGKNIYASISGLTINSNANINGNVIYTSDNQAKIDPNAKISGQVEMKQIPVKSQTETNTQKASTFLLSLLSILLVGIILLLIMPKKAEELADLIKTKFWTSFGIGFLLLLVVPIAIIMLFAIFIGIPLALILTALYIFAIYISKVFVGLALGKLITHEKWSPIWAMTFGVIILSIACIIPYLGGVIGFIIILLGLGSIGVLLFSKNR